MLYAYDKEQGTLVRCAETDFKSLDVTERFHIEEWVKADPSVLGEDLMVITSEFSGFDKTNERLDVLAIDSSGTLVVIELKRDDSGKHVDLQALKYAAYCSPMTLDDIAAIHASYCGNQLTADEARQSIEGFIADDSFEELGDKPRVMLVSREFRPEVTASVKWLRDEFGVDITCIKWDVYELPNKQVVVETSTLIPQPEMLDFEMRVQRKERAERFPSRIQQATDKFFSECATSLATYVQGNYPRPHDQSFYRIQTPVPAVHYEWGFHGRPRSSLGVELHFESNRQRSEELFLACEPYIPAAEAALGQKVKFENPWGTRWARIYIESDSAEVNDDLAKWAVEKMVTLMEVMKPAIDSLK